MKEELCPECEMEIDEDEFEIEQFRCPRCGKIHELAVWKGEANKKEISEKDFEKVFERCRKLRGLPKDLRHRVFYDFGFFLQEMVDYLVFGLLSEDTDIRKFQEKIDANKYDPEKFETYLELFEKFY